MSRVGDSRSCSRSCIRNHNRNRIRSRSTSTMGDSSTSCSTSSMVDSNLKYQFIFRHLLLLSIQYIIRFIYRMSCMNRMNRIHIRTTFSIQFLGGCFTFVSLCVFFVLDCSDAFQIETQLPFIRVFSPTEISQSSHHDVH